MTSRSSKTVAPQWTFDEKRNSLALSCPSLGVRLANIQIQVEVAGQRVNLLERKQRAKTLDSADTPLGLTKRKILESNGAGLYSSITLDTHGNSGWAALQLMLRDTGNTALTIEKVNLLEIVDSLGGILDLGRPPAEYRVLVESGASGNYTGVRSLVANEGVHESKHVSTLYSPTNAVAFLAGQGTIEETWVRINTEYGEKDHLGNYVSAQHQRIKRWCIECDFAEYALTPGKEVATDYILLGFHRDPFFLLENYADAVCKLNKVREFQREEIPVGWMTWYNQDSHLRGGNAQGAVKEEVVLEQAKFVSQHLKEYGVKFIFIDEGYEQALGEWEANEFVPSGMNGLAKKIKKLHLIPGLWLSPFMVSERARVFKEHPDGFAKKAGTPFAFWQWPMAPSHDNVYIPDPTSSRVQKWVSGIYKKFVRSGYRFFKNDFVDGLGLTDIEFSDKKITRGLKLWRQGFRTIREAVGTECHIQPCSGPTIAGVGIVDSARIEADVGGGVGQNQWNTLRAVARGVACKYYQHRKFYINDPDNLIVSEYEQFKSYGSKAKFAHAVAMMKREAQVRASIAVLSGGTICLGDRLTYLNDEQLALIRKCLPVYGAAAKPIDMFKNEFPELWSLEVQKLWGKWKIISVFNWEDVGKVVTLSPEELGLNARKSYLIWELWNEELLGEFSPRLQLSVPNHGTKLLRITEKYDHPSVAGTDMHLLQGAVELEDVHWDGSSLSGRAIRPKGARGRIFLHVPAGYRPATVKVNGRSSRAEAADGRGPFLALAIRFAQPEVRWEVAFRETY
jgi:alpha-galactosidase